MTALATLNPIPQYFDLDGSPLDAGRLYFGAVNGNPITAPVTVYWDAAATQPAAQPIRTLNGYPVRAGAPAVVYATGNYSLLAQDRFGRQVIYARDSADFGNAAALAAGFASTASGMGAALIGRGLQLVNSMTELRALLKTSASKFAYLTGYYSAFSGGGGHFSLIASDTTSTDNGGTVIVATDGGRWYRDFTGPVQAQWFGYVADASPTTYISAGGYGAGNVTALNAAITAAWLNKNHAPNVLGGGYGGQVIIPPGYGQLSGALPVVIPPAISLVGFEQYVSVLCCTATYRPQVTMTDGNTRDLGAVYFNVSGLPYSAVPGYPTMLRGVALLSLNSAGPGVVVNSNTTTLRDLWVAGFLGPGIVLQNTNTLVEGGVSELNGTGLLFDNFSFGNTVDGMQFNFQLTGVTVNNRKWYAVGAAGNVGGATPVVVISANQGLNTGYTFQGTAVPAANFTGYRVRVMSGTGVGQTGTVSACVLNGTFQFVLTITSDIGAWVATDAASKVVIFNASLENTVTNAKGLTQSFCHVNIVEAFKFQLDDLACSQSVTLPSNGAVFIQSSESVTITGIGASAALDYRQASATKNGIIIGTGNKNITINGGEVSGWANGVFQGAGCLTDGLTITGLTSTGNSNSGVTIQDGLKTNICGGNFSNNGSAFTPGTGLSLSNPQANATITVTGTTVSSLVNGASGFQTTGISATAATASSRITLNGNTVTGHGPADYALAGSTEAIFTDRSVPRATPTIPSAANLIVPASSAGGGFVAVSGTATITSITPIAGGQVTLVFLGALTLTDGGNLSLAGNFVTTADDVITLFCDGTRWVESARSVN